MIDPEAYSQIQQEIAERMEADREILNQLRAEIRPLKGQVRRIQPRVTTSISLVGTDGGNNSIQFDPFLVEIVRVVDSSNNQYCLEAITPTTKTSELSRNQFYPDGSPRTPLGEMMSFLGVTELSQLSHWIPNNDDASPVNPGWIKAYRELMEWAVLFSIIRTKSFGTNTLIVFDGLLRTKVFALGLFNRYREGLADTIETVYRTTKRKLYIAGVAKHSKVLTRYRLAMALEGILATDYPAYVEIPREIEANAYIWSVYARGDETERADLNRFVGGKMFFVKFGSGRRDPIWPVDIFQPQVPEAQMVLGYLLADALNGFPVPFYPLCLQKAHENAALVDFDFDILQEEIFNGLRQALGDEAPALDIFRLQDSDPAKARY
jgi:hypothetical protein